MLPSLQLMIGRYLGYKPPTAAEPKLTDEQHAERLMRGLMGM